jgi:sugar (pentulose or hexulose) kinase
VSDQHQPLVLALDLGTTAIKVALYTSDGRSVASASREYELLTPQPGWVEVDCETYWAAFTAATQKVVAAVDAKQIKAIALSAQGETLVAVDEASNALHNAIVWLDNRAAGEAAELAERFSRERIYEATGQPEMLAAWPAAKLLWMNRNTPHICRRAARFLLIEDYFLLKLTGEAVTEGSLATSTCYWDFRQKAWWPEMLAAIGVEQEQLPAIVEPGEKIGVLRPKVAEELGLGRDVVVCAGALDQACGAIGAGNIGPGGFSENTGAAIALCATLGGALLDPLRRMPCHYHGVRDTYMFHTFTSGGIVLKWFRDQFCEIQLEQARQDAGDGYEQLGALAEKAGPGAEGLLMLPHLQGAMAPENNDQARGVLVGLTLKHGRGHIVRAIMEAIAFVVRRNVEVLTDLGVEIDSVRALGGGSRSAVWKQIEADVLGLPIVTMQEVDAGTLGAAMLAGVAIGWWDNLSEAVEEAVTEKAVYEPNLANRQLYDELYGAFADAYAALEPLFPVLASA